MLKIITGNLAQIDIHHDVYFHESDLHKKDIMENMLQYLRDKELIFEGTLPPPRGYEDTNWVQETHTLFKSTAFGDDQDRVVKKANGKYTYFAPELAYLKSKFDRKFDWVIIVLGADHIGYLKRFEAAAKAIMGPDVLIDIPVYQLVNYLENGVPIKMSKRSGNFTTMTDVVNEVGKDPIRFMMAATKPNSVMDFDFEKVKEQSKNNPLFYVQYAYVRILSVIKGCEEKYPDVNTIITHKRFDLNLLSLEHEIDLIKTLALWPRIIESAIKHFEPHRIPMYIESVASEFHSLWSFTKPNEPYRIIVEGNPELTAARVALALSVGHVISSGAKIIGIDLPNYM